MSQTFEEQQTAIYYTMQSLIHQIDEISNDTKFRFKFKKECDHFYKILERCCESFTGNFTQDTTDSYVSIVTELDNIAKSIKIKTV